MVMGNLMDRRFEKDVSSKGDIIHVPNLAAMTVGDKGANSAVTFVSTAETKVDITINQHKYVAFEIEDIAEVQADRNLRQMYTTRAGYDLAAAIDSYCCNMIDNFSQTVGTDNVDVTDDNLLTCLTYLDNANAPVVNRAWVISPETRSSIMKIDKFVRMDYVKPTGQTAIESAMLSQPLYGAPVYVTTQLKDGSSGHIMGLFHKEAMALVVQRKPMVHVMYYIDNLDYKVVVDVIFGTMEMRDTFGAELLGK